MQEMLFYLLFHSTKELHINSIAIFLRSYFRHIKIQDIKRTLETDSKYIQTAEDRWQITDLSYFVANQSIKDTSFVITDIETTGPIMGKDKVIEIAAQKVKDGQLIDSFSMLVNPEQRIPTNIQKLTHITDADVAGAATIHEVILLFSEFVKGSVFVAHNSKFDFLFLNHVLKQEDLPYLDPYIEICTFRLARKLLPNVRSCGIKGLSKHFEYPLINRHRAMPDVEAAAFYLQQFLKKLADKQIKTLHELIQFQRDTGINHTLRKKEKRAF